MPKKILKKGRGLTREQLDALAHSFHPSQGIDALPRLDADALRSIKHYVPDYLEFVVLSKKTKQLEYIKIELSNTPGSIERSDFGGDAQGFNIYIHNGRFVNNPLNLDSWPDWSRPKHEESAYNLEEQQILDIEIITDPPNYRRIEIKAHKKNTSNKFIVLFKTKDIIYIETDRAEVKDLLDMFWPQTISPDDKEAVKSAALDSKAAVKERETIAKEEKELEAALVSRAIVREAMTKALAGKPSRKRKSKNLCMRWRKGTRCKGRRCKGRRCKGTRCKGKEKRKSTRGKRRKT